MQGVDTMDRVSRLLRNRIICIFIPMMICIVGFLGLVKVAPSLGIFSSECLLNGTVEKGIKLETGRTVVQSFVMPYGRVSGLNIYFRRTGENHKSRIMLELFDSEGKLLYDWTVREDLLPADGFQSFEMGRSVEAEQGAVYSLVLNAEDSAGSCRVGASSVDLYDAGELTVSGKGRNQDIAFSVCGTLDGAPQKGIFGLIYAVFSVLFIMCFYSMAQGKQKQEFDTIHVPDWILVGVAAISCALLFSQYMDIELTIKHSEDLISAVSHGQFFDFYDIVLDKAMAGGYGRASFLDGANYNIFLYLILSVMIFPWVLLRKLTGFQYDYVSVSIYVQFLLIILDLIAAGILSAVCRAFGCEKKHAWLVSYLFLSSTITLFATAGFAQLDIIYIIIMLVSLLFYARGQHYRFSLVISVAVMLKIFPVMVFIPLILLTNKKVWQIMVNMVLALSSSVVFAIMFGSDAGYATTKEMMDGYYNFTQRLVSSAIPGGMSQSALFLVLFVILCIWAYGSEVRTADQKYRYVVFIGVAVFADFAVFVLWHPQWMVLLSVFVAMAVPLFGRTRVALYCDLALQILYLVITSIYFPQNVDNYMVNYGILPRLTGHLYNGLTIQQISSRIDYIYVMAFSAFTGVIVAFLLLLGRQLRTESDVVRGHSCERLLIWARTAVLYGYCLLLCLFFFYLG